MHIKNILTGKVKHQNTVNNTVINAISLRIDQLPKDYLNEFNLLLAACGMLIEDYFYSENSFVNFKSYELEQFSVFYSSLMMFYSFLYTSNFPKLKHHPGIFMGFTGTVILDFKSANRMLDGLAKNIDGEILIEAPKNEYELMNAVNKLYDHLVVEAYLIDMPAARLGFNLLCIVSYTRYLEVLQGKT